jgi:ankyrin repeat protein
LENGADVNLRNETGATPLFLASQRGDPKLVKQLLHNGCDVNVTDQDMNNCLHAALSSCLELEDPTHPINDRLKSIYLLISGGVPTNKLNRVSWSSISPSTHPFLLLVYHHSIHYVHVQMDQSPVDLSEKIGRVRFFLEKENRFMNLRMLDLYNLALKVPHILAPPSHIITFFTECYIFVL